VGDGEGPFAFTPDGSQLLIAGFGFGERIGAALHEVSTGEEVHFFPISSIVSALAISVDGLVLALGTVSGTIRLYRLTDYTEIATWSAHSNWVDSIAFSPDGTFSSAGRDATIRIWDPDGIPLLYYDQEVGRQGLRAPALAYSPDGQYLAYQRSDPALVMAINPFGPLAARRAVQAPAGPAGGRREQQSRQRLGADQHSP
jgi:WD40 repeat protein